MKKCLFGLLLCLSTALAAEMQPGSVQYKNAVKAIDAVNGVVTACPFSAGDKAETLCALTDMPSSDSRAAIASALSDMRDSTAWEAEADEGQFTDAFVRSFYSRKGILRTALFQEGSRQYLMVVYISLVD